MKKTQRTGAHALLDMLRAEDVEYVFGNPGTTELPIIDALLDFPEIKYIWGLQEASVVAMADGYAQASGKPGFLNLHTAGGVGHGFGSLLNASVGKVPLVVTAGQQDSRHRHTDPLLFGDLEKIAEPIAKWTEEVTDASQLPTLIRRAFQDVCAEPRGPVFLSLPMDVMEQPTDAKPLASSEVDRRPIASSLNKLAERLTQYTPGRVAIIAGDEVATYDAFDQVVELSELLCAPVFGSSWPGHLVFPTFHHNWQGNLPTVSTLIGEIMKDYDAIFALGGKSFITILYSEGTALPENCELYQLSCDGQDLGRTYPTCLSVVGDIARSLSILNGKLGSVLDTLSPASQAAKNSAQTRQREKRNALIAKVEALRENTAIHPMVASYELMMALPTNVTVVDEAIATMKHVRNLIEITSVGQYVFNRGGGLGWGMPAAVGFSLGLQRSPVVSLVGDGAALYSPQAMWTAAHEKLPVTFVIINNREYNVLKNFMLSKKEYVSAQTNRFIAMDMNDPYIQFAPLASSMGLTHVLVENVGDIGSVLKSAISSGLPNVIEIKVSAERD